MLLCNKCGKEIKENDQFCPHCGAPNDLYKEKEDIEDQVNILDKTIKHSEKIYGVINLEDIPVGYIIDERYEIKEKLGQGGFGAVYRVYDKKMNIDKALKVIPEEITNDIEAMTDLQNEAQTMIKLNHPNIVRVYDFHDTGRIKYIDMEYIDGKTLTEIKIKHPDKQMPEEEVKNLALKIADGLAYAHNINVIHKDIKPQNVMVTKDNKVKIMDFGIAETVRTSMSRIQNTSSSGTLVYMSPEQLRGKNVGKESDIYSFGAMLYELLSGHPPFYRGDINYQILNEKPKLLENVSDKMNELILKCLEKEYKKRYNNFSEIINILDGQQKKYSSIPSRKKSLSSSKKLKTLTIVSITTEPENATLTIDDRKQNLQTPFKQKLTIGSHKIKITEPGYKTIKDEISISETSTNDFYIELESVMGSITVETDKPGQTIWLNDEETELITPFSFEGLVPPGVEFTFQIKTVTYLSEPIKVTLKELEEKKILLPSILGSITVKSETPRQLIYLNEKKTDKKTPVTFEYLKPGKYEIQLKSDNYYSESKIVNLKEKEEKVVLLPSILGSIKVDSKISKQKIYLNGVDTGKKTPASLENLMPVKYEVQLKSENYYSEPKIINLKGKRKITVKPDLIAYSRLKVLSSYQDISFQISDYKMRSSAELKLKTGKYSLIPSFEYLPTLEVELKPGERIELDYDKHIKRKTLTINTGQYEVEAIIENKTRQTIENLTIQNKKDISLLPGEIKVNLKHKRKTNEYNISLITEDKHINFGKVLDLIIKKHNRKIRNRIITIISLLVLIIAGWISIPPILENISWKEATSEHSLQSYKKYLDKYPNGKNKEEAIRLNNKLKEITERYLNEAASYLNRSNLSKAKERYNSVLALYPNNSKTLSALLNIQMNIKESENYKRNHLRTMVLVQGGTFQMGTNNGDSDEKPVHTVYIDDFYIGKYEVTQKQWEEVMGDNPSRFKGEYLMKKGFLGFGAKTEYIVNEDYPVYPVERVRWNEVVEFCNKLSKKEGLSPCYTGSRKKIKCNFSANGYRLPTEAEWEYAAKGGNKSKGYKYSGSNNVDEVAWYYDNSGSKTHPVGERQPNELGIYDMSGNVCEWCWDWYDENYYKQGANNNPQGPSSGKYRVSRGSSYYYVGIFCLVTARYYHRPLLYTNSTVGFRLCRIAK